MSDFNFGIKAILPSHTESKSADPVGDDIVKITQEFAKLIIAQISNQDPDKPVETTEMISQYSQMLATMGAIKSNNTIEQMSLVDLGNSLVGRRISFERVGRFDTSLINPDTGNPGVYIPPSSGSGTVIGVDYSLEKPQLIVDGQDFPIPIGEVVFVHPSDSATNTQLGANIVGKTVTYYTGNNLPNPDFGNPGEPEFIPEFKTGIVTSIDFSNSVPEISITGEANQIMVTRVQKIHN